MIGRISFFSIPRAKRRVALGRLRSRPKLEIPDYLGDTVPLGAERRPAALSGEPLAGLKCVQGQSGFASSEQRLCAEFRLCAE